VRVRTCMSYLVSSAKSLKLFRSANFIFISFTYFYYYFCDYVLILGLLCLFRMLFRVLVGFIV